MAPQEVGKFVAERIDAMLQALIEHVANHDHSALRPLAHAAELWMIELRLAPISLRERAEQRKRHVKADPMARCDIGHDSKTFGREVRHSCEPWAKESRFTGKRSVRTNAYTWFARSASLGNRREGPRVCL